MAEVIRKYENMIIFDPNVGEATISRKIDEIKSLISKFGKILDVEIWGLRRLAYPINKQLQGYYTIIRFESSTKLLAELKDNYKLTKEIMRYIVVRCDNYGRI